MPVGLFQQNELGPSICSAIPPKKKGTRRSWFAVTDHPAAGIKQRQVVTNDIVSYSVVKSQALSFARDAGVVGNDRLQQAEFATVVAALHHLA